MGWDWYDAPGLAPSLLTVALGATIAAGALSERADRRRTHHLAAFALLGLAATLIAPFLVEIAASEDEIAR